MTSHSDILAWRIPWTEEPDGYGPWGCRESDLTEHAHKNCYYLKKWTVIFKNVCSLICHFLLSRQCCFCPYLLYWVHFSSVAQLCLTLWTAACQASLSITNSQSLLKLMSLALVMSSNHLILCGSLLLLSSVFPIIVVFSSESVLYIRWPMYWSFSFSISPSNKHSELISFRMDWLDLLAVQGTLKSLLQNYSSKTSILWCSAFFIVQFSHPYILHSNKKE